MVCHKCDKQVNGTKKFSWLLFLILIFTGIGWGFYLLYYFLKRPTCELCGAKL